MKTVRRSNKIAVYVLYKKCALLSYVMLTSIIYQVHATSMNR